MTYLQETGLPRAPYDEIVEEANVCASLFCRRESRHADRWFSLDIILHWELTQEARFCPAFVRWIERSVPWIPNRAYIARLDPGGCVNWHVDLADSGTFSVGFLLGLHSPEGSFVEFRDGGRHSYEPGVSYHARLGVPHRAVNPTAEARLTAFVGSPTR
jgi:hypothetical protein